MKMSLLIHPSSLLCSRRSRPTTCQPARFQPPSPRFRGLGPRPRTIVFGNVKSLQFLPGLHRLFSRGAFLPCQEVAHEVDVSVLGDMSKRPPGLIESNVFFD